MQQGLDPPLTTPGAASRSERRAHARCRRRWPLALIPAAGEIPIVQTLMAFGLGEGPAVALLTTLPPVSLPSLVMVGKVVLARVLAFLVVTVAPLGLTSAAIAVGLRF